MKNNESSSSGRLDTLRVGLIAIVATGVFVAVAANAEEPASSQSMSIEQEHLKTGQKHHYDSPADRAQDALLITEVKSALAQDGVADGHAVEVDCDHGRVRLSGAVDSAADAKHAEQLASSVQGVSGVDNRLIWR
jgi:osmotically-inducible protein OsmY